MKLLTLLLFAGLALAADPNQRIQVAGLDILINHNMVAPVTLGFAGGQESQARIILEMKDVALTNDPSIVGWLFVYDATLASGEVVHQNVLVPRYGDNYAGQYFTLKSNVVSIDNLTYAPVRPDLPNKVALQ